MQVRVSTQRLREETHGYQVRHFRFANRVKRMLQELNDLSMTGVDDHENCSSSSYWYEVSVSSSSAASNSTWTGVNYPPYAGGGFGLEQRWNVISAASRSLWKGQKGARDPAQIYQTKQIQRY
jgi:hypothetical protein